jgi:ribosomal protein S27AE
MLFKKTSCPECGAPPVAYLESVVTTIPIELNQDEGPGWHPADQLGQTYWEGGEQCDSNGRAYPADSKKITLRCGSCSLSEWETETVETCDHRRVRYLGDERHCIDCGEVLS